MKIAVTGSNGRVGQAVVRHAVEEGHEVVAIDLDTSENGAPEHSRVIRRIADCCDREALKSAMDGSDALIHLAAIPTPRWHPDHVVHNRNVVGSYNALSVAAELGVRRICQASSVNAIGLAFGNQGRFDYFPIDEEHPTYCEDAYSLSKWICEQQADAFARRDPSLAIASLRFHLVVADRSIAEQQYLPGEHDADKHLWGYTLSRDAASACLRSLTAGFSGHEVFYIVADDTLHSRPSLDLAREFFPNVPVTGDMSGRRSFFTNGKARRILGPWNES